MAENSTPEELLKNRLQTAKDFQKNKFDIFSEIDQVIHVKGVPQPGDAQIHGPDSWANVETVAPRMVSRRPTVIYKPRQDGTPTGAEGNQALFNYWWDKDEAFDTTIRTVKGGLNKGKAMVRWSWKHEEQEVTKYVFGPDGKPAIEAQIVRDGNNNVLEVLPIEQILQITNGDVTSLNPEQQRFAEEKETVVTFDDAHMERISMYDWFIDPEATTVQSAQWIIFRYRKSLQELKSYKRFKGLKKLENALSASDSRTKADGEGYKEAESIATGTGNFKDDSTTDRVTCYEMWEMGPKGRRVTTIAAGNEVIEPWTANPYWCGLYPFSDYVDSITGDGFWDFAGEIEPVLGLQYALDTLISVDMTNRMRATDPKWKVDGEVDESEIWNSSVIHVDTKNGDDANPVQVQDLTGTSQAGIAQVRQFMSNALGIFDVNRGDSTPSNQTASGISITAEQGNARFGLKIQHLEQFFKEMGFFVMSLYQQHMTDEKILRVVGQNGKDEIKKLTPQDVAGGYDIEIETGSSRPPNRDAERQDALQVYQLTQTVQDPEFQQEALKFVLDKFDGTAELKEALDAAFQRQQDAKAAASQAVQDQAAQNTVMQGHQAKVADFANRDKAITDQMGLVMKHGKGLQPDPAAIPPPAAAPSAMPAFAGAGA